MSIVGFIVLGGIQTAVRACQVPKWAYCKIANQPFEWFSFNVQ